MTGERLEITHFTDPGCPFAYSASPALRVLEWRYGEQLRWRIRTIVIAGEERAYLAWAPDPAGLARVEAGILRRYGMPALLHPHGRFIPTTRACRAVVAARLVGGEPLAGRALRALQLAWFTSPLALDRDGDIAAALERFGVPAAAVLGELDGERAAQALARDRDAARAAAGTAASVQGRTARDGRRERFTAPTLALGDNGTQAVAGGMQTVEAYDLLVANVAPWLVPREPPADLLELFAAFPDGLTTQEVAALAASPGEPVRRADVELWLVELFAEHRLDRTQLGDDALWSVARPPQRAEARSRPAH